MVRGLAVLSGPVRAALLAAAIICAAPANYQFARHALRYSTGLDFMVFWRAGRDAIPYSVKLMPFLNPPPALFLFKPLGQLPLAPAFAIMTVASIGIFLWVAARQFGRGPALISLASPPAVRGLLLGQCSMLLSGLALLAFSLSNFAGGVMLGVVMALKPQLIFLAPVALIVRRDWHMLSGLAISSLGLALASFLMWPETWAAWLSVLPHLQDALTDAGNMPMVITPAGRADSLGLPTVPFLLLGGGIGLAAVCTLARSLEGPFLAALIISASIVSSPYALSHDLIGLAPVAVFFILRGNWLLAIAGVALFVGSYDLAPYLLGGGLLALTVWRVTAWGPTEITVGDGQAVAAITT